MRLTRRKRFVGTAKLLRRNCPAAKTGTIKSSWNWLGTPAPIDPPRKLGISGPYRYVRNPMYVGMGLVLVGFAIVYPHATLVFLGELVFDDVVAQFDALIADVDAGAGDELADLPLPLPAEGTLQVLGTVLLGAHIRLRISGLHAG